MEPDDKKYRSLPLKEGDKEYNKGPIIVKMENGSNFKIELEDVRKYTEETLREEIKSSSGDSDDENDEEFSSDLITIQELKALDLKLYILKLISIKPGVRKVEQITLFSDGPTNTQCESMNYSTNDKIYDKRNKFEGEPLPDCENLFSILSSNGYMLSMILSSSKVSVSITRKLRNSYWSSQIETFSTCSIYYLKLLILQKLSTETENEDICISDLNLHYGRSNLKDNNFLSDYGINGLISSASTQPASANLTRHRRNTPSISDQSIYELVLVIGEKSLEGTLKLGIDFTFNTIKDVKRVEWSNKAPDHCEIKDGMCWMCYCNNEECSLFKNLFIKNRGYGKFSLIKELQKVKKCPECKSSDILVRNLGFVKAEWKMQGKLKNGVDNKINSKGKSYDSKLYTFKEMDYQNDWVELRVDLMPSEPLPTVKTESEIETVQESEKSENLDEVIDDITDAPSSRIEQGCMLKMACCRFFS